jgi:hypothetical protein
MSVRIGKWFASKRMMVISGNFSPQYSKEVMSDTGFPLWASVAPTFSPYRAISYQEWMEFFI